MRLVLDTNVLISAILSPNSLPAKILNWGEYNGMILYSSATLAELLSVLERPKFAKYIEADEIQCLSIRIQATWFSVSIVREIKLCRDAKDDKFIELAVNGDATYLISGDNDLLVLRTIQGIPVVNPRAFWDEVIEKNK